MALTSWAEVGSSVSTGYETIDPSTSVNYVSVLSAPVTTYSSVVTSVSSTFTSIASAPVSSFDRTYSLNPYFPVPIFAITENRKWNEFSTIKWSDL